MVSKTSQEQTARTQWSALLTHTPSSLPKRPRRLTPEQNQQNNDRNWHSKKPQQRTLTKTHNTLLSLVRNNARHQRKFQIACESEFPADACSRPAQAASLGPMRKRSQSRI